MIVLLIFIAVVGQACPAHQFLNVSEGTCEMCDISCYLCENTSLSCLSCSQTYYQNVLDSTCLKCMAGCASCISGSNCTSCLVGYFLQQNQCSKCGFNCMICISNTICRYCSAGYDISTNCTACSKEYYWRNATSSCVYCGIGCRACDSMRCNLCSQKYILEQNGTCLYSPRAAKQSKQNDSSSQPMNKEAIIGVMASVGGLILLIMLICKLYRCYKKHQNLINVERKTSLDQIVVVSNLQIELSKEGSIQQSQILQCQACGKEGADYKAPCSHSYHQICYESHSNSKCLVCREEISVITAEIGKESHLQGQSDFNDHLSRNDFFQVEESNNSIANKQ